MLTLFCLGLAIILVRRFLFDLKQFRSSTDEMWRARWGYTSKGIIQLFHFRKYFLDIVSIDRIELVFKFLLPSLQYFGHLIFVHILPFSLRYSNICVYWSINTFLRQQGFLLSCVLRVITVEELVLISLVISAVRTGKWWTSRSHNNIFHSIITEYNILALE